MRRVLTLALLLAALVASSPAAVTVFRGGALSNRDVTVNLVARLHSTGPSSFAGRVRCRPGTARCLLGPRAAMQITIYNPDFVTGGMANHRGACTFVGVLACFMATGFGGSYTCARNDGATDSGSFLLCP